jgi:hypothetical protein
MNELRGPFIKHVCFFVPRHARNHVKCGGSLPSNALLNTSRGDFYGLLACMVGAALPVDAMLPVRWRLSVWCHVVYMFQTMQGGQGTVQGDELGWGSKNLASSFVIFFSPVSPERGTIGVANWCVAGLYVASG